MLNFIAKLTVMKKIIALFSFCVLLTGFSQAQSIYSVDAEYKADITVYVVDAEYKADLSVFRVDAEYKADGNKGLWFFTDAEYKADRTIYFVDAEYKADLLIYFVDGAYKAEWEDKSKMHLMYD